MVSRAVLNGWPIVPTCKPTLAPANVSAPVISGFFTLASVLSVSDGLWVGFPAPLITYQWTRDGADIAGATASTYTVVDADVGKVVSVRVKATNVIGSATISVTGSTCASLYVPPGYTRTTINGAAVEYNGRSIYDNANPNNLSVIVP